MNDTEVLDHDVFAPDDDDITSDEDSASDASTVDAHNRRENGRAVIANGASPVMSSRRRDT